jgi:Tfp pilus assembly protein PilF
MSLLLKALARAEQTREAQTPAAPQELALVEPVEPEVEPKRISDDYRPADAAALLAAATEPKASIVDFIQDRAFGFIIALLLLIIAGWWIYVYLAVQSPSLYSAPRSSASAGSAASAVGPVPPPSREASTQPERLEAAQSGRGPAGPEASSESPKPSQDQATEKPVKSSEKTVGLSAQPEVKSAGSTPIKSASTKPPPRPAPGESLSVSRAKAEPKVNPLLASAYQAYRESRLEAAKTLYQEFLHQEPNSLDGLLGLAAIDALEGRAERAAQSYVRALELDPKNATAQAGLIGLLGQADPLAAETKLKALIAREPSAFLYFTLGNLYADQVQWPSAQAAYFQAFHLAPENPDYAYNLAVALEHINQPRSALSYYREAIHLADKAPGVHFEPAQARARIEQLQLFAE